MNRRMCPVLGHLNKGVSGFCTVPNQCEEKKMVHFVHFFSILGGKLEPCETVFLLREDESCNSGLACLRGSGQRKPRELVPFSCIVM